MSAPFPEVLFSVHDFDRDGDVTEHGIYLHFSNTRVKVAHDLESFKDFIAYLQTMVEEITSQYPDA